ncbi:MAG: glycosyltransferase family 4 protein [Dehalococcoidales bacterium]
MDINEDMKKNIWLWNHYATNMYFDQGGRHYWLAKYLIKDGYDATVFCANTKHNSDEIIDTEGKKYIIKETNGIPFVFVKTSPYKGNGISRVRNMLRFAINLCSMSKRYANENDMPDVILASSVHPLTLVAGICAAKRLKVPCICEVRDLWPETLVAYGSIKKNSLISKILYAGEKWIYKKADRLIFTMEGGKDYIIEKGWDKDSGGPIDLSKVFHISNGVDLEAFDYDKEHYQIDHEDLTGDEFRVVYTGSLRKWNSSIWDLIHAGKLIEEKTEQNVIFLIYGSGDELKKMATYCEDNGIGNVKFKGGIAKKYIPFILSSCNLNILNCSANEIMRFGGSQNKLFEYLASGNPIISGEESQYSIINKYGLGISKQFENVQELANTILEIKKDMEQGSTYTKEEILDVSGLFDYNVLTNTLIQIICELCG